MRYAIAGAIIAAGLLACRAAPAQEPPVLIQHHGHHESEGMDPLVEFHSPDSNIGRSRRGQGPVRKNPLEPNDFYNTGRPDQLSHWAVPTRTSPYYGYYVGGGAKPGKGEPRCAAAEGTWGWDYTGGILPRKVALLWSHGRLVQDGQGRYKNTYPIEYRNPLYRLESPRLYFEGGSEAPAIEAGSR